MGKNGVKLVMINFEHSFFPEKPDQELTLDDLLSQLAHFKRLRNDAVYALENFVKTLNRNLENWTDDLPPRLQPVQQALVDTQEQTIKGYDAVISNIETQIEQIKKQQPTVN